ncbi:hypothetical protein HQ520_08065 [bacterium]|nr:hypothetical protein [bacterium]
MVDFLTHYYRKNKPPFQSMSRLSDEEAERMGLSLLEENPKAFGRFRKFQTYWPRRKRTDQWVRSEFKKRGGRPTEAYPQYMVLGTSRYILELGGDGGYAEIRIPLSEFAANEVSFTYSDCMVSLWLAEEQQDQEYFNPDLHAKVFNLPEILEVSAIHGIPNGEWETDPKKAFDFFIEAQVWSLRPLKKYMEISSETDGGMSE